MPSLSPATDHAAEILGSTNAQFRQRESAVMLESGITLMANALYQERQRGAGTVLLNTYGFGVGSASAQDYAEKLREAARQDPVLAQGLTRIGISHQAGAAPTAADMGWLEKHSIASVRQAEGKASQGAGWLSDMVKKD